MLRQVRRVLRGLYESISELEAVANETVPHPSDTKFKRLQKFAKSMVVEREVIKMKGQLTGYQSAVPLYQQVSDNVDVVAIHGLGETPPTDAWTALLADRDVDDKFAFVAQHAGLGALWIVRASYLELAAEILDFQTGSPSKVCMSKTVPAPVVRRSTGHHTTKREDHGLPRDAAIYPYLSLLKPTSLIAAL